MSRHKEETDAAYCRTCAFACLLHRAKPIDGQNKIRQDNSYGKKACALKCTYPSIRDVSCCIFLAPLESLHFQCHQGNKHPPMGIHGRFSKLFP